MLSIMWNDKYIIFLNKGYLDTCNWYWYRCLCVYIMFYASHLLQPTVLMSYIWPTHPHVFIELYLCVYSTCCSLWRGRMWAFVSGQQMDSAASLLSFPLSVLLIGVWHQRATGHGNQRGFMSSPLRPAISMSGRHLPTPPPAAAWRSCSQRTFAERRRGGESLQIWLLQALGEKSACWGPFCSPSLLSDWLRDNRRCGRGVCWAVMPTVCTCVSVCVHLRWLHVIWPIGQSH